MPASSSAPVPAGGVGAAGIGEDRDAGADAERPGEREADPFHLVDVDAALARRVEIAAHRVHVSAERGTRQQHPERRRDAQNQHEHQRHAAAGLEVGHGEHEQRGNDDDHRDPKRETAAGERLPVWRAREISAGRHNHGRRAATTASDSHSGTRASAISLMGGRVSGM